jgi:hypothetical protein
MGGKPEHEQRFLDLVHALAAEVDRLCIDTNGSFLPQDQAAANDYLAQFPRNTIFLLSVDRSHAEALARHGWSLAKIFHVLECACKANLLGFEINLRYFSPTNKMLATQELATLCAPYYSPPGRSFLRGPRIFPNNFYAQGEAGDLPLSGIRPVSLADFVRHSYQIQDVGVFITPEGLVICSDHAAFMAAPPAFAVLGDLHEETLARIVWDHILPGVDRTGGKSAYFRNGSILFDVRGEARPPFAPSDLERIKSRACEGRPEVPLEEIIALMQSDASVVWRIDYARDSVLTSFGEEAVNQAIIEGGQKFVERILQYETMQEPRIDFFFTVKDKKLSLDFKITDDGIGRFISLDNFGLFIVTMWQHLPLIDVDAPFPTALMLRRMRLFVDSVDEHARRKLPQISDPALRSYLTKLFEEIEAEKKRLDRD